MSKESPMYKKYGPENNAQITYLIEGKVNEGSFAPITILGMLDAAIPTNYFPGIDKDLVVDEEHYKGFKAALTLAMATMYSAIDNDAAAIIKLRNSGTPQIKDDGTTYLSRGKPLFLLDKTGITLLADVIRYIQSNFQSPDFLEGAKAAQSVYLAYLQRF